MFIGKDIFYPTISNSCRLIHIFPIPFLDGYFQKSFAISQNIFKSFKYYQVQVLSWYVSQILPEKCKITQPIKKLFYSTIFVWRTKLFMILSCACCGLRKSPCYTPRRRFKPFTFPTTGGRTTCYATIMCLFNLKSIFCLEQL